MCSATATVSAPVIFKRATLRDTAVLLTLAWAVPFAVHLAPWAGERPLGAYLLPMFWTTLVAAYFYGARIGALTGLFAPAVNLAVTGLPAWKFFGVLGLELVVFALVVAEGVRRFPRAFVVAPVACIIAKLVAFGVLALTAAISFGSVGASLVSGGVGILVLAAIHFALVQFYPKAR